MSKSARRRPPAQRSKPPDPRLIKLVGVDYFVRWEDLTVGASFFMPTTATVRQAIQVLDPAAAAYDYDIAVRRRREFGILGVRVWRTL